MANKKYKLANSDYWETSGVYDITEGKTQREVNASLKGSLNAITPLTTAPTNGSGKGITSGAVYNLNHYKQGDTANYAGLIVGRTGTGKNTVYVVLHLPKIIDVPKANISVSYASGATPVLYPTSSELLNIITDAGYQINSILDQNSTITVNDVSGDRVGLLLPFATTLTAINNNTTPRTAIADVSLVFHFN